MVTDATRTPDISKAKFETLKNIFVDEKVARQVLNAAKRVDKKRKSSDASAVVPPSPKKVKSLYGPPLSPSELEASLALPGAELDETKLKSIILFTNRAPLVLAFAYVLLQYTLPRQPTSSKLSLAQAVVSMNSRSKAVHIGLEGGQAAEDEGWGEGQPIIRIMTRDVRVMKRWGYEWEESTQETLKSTQDTLAAESENVEPALWGVDLEALKKANQPGAVGSYKGASNHLPIYTAQSARAYLLKAFDSPPKADGVVAKKRTNTTIGAEKERNLSLLLGALQLLFESWAQVLNKEDLDKRAWGWYVRVRPEVAQGVEGWGGKGNIYLSDILDLRRPPG